MRTFRRIAVYCASSDDVDPRYFEAAADVGQKLAGKGIGVVYGGGKVGLMGALANGALGAGGEVYGVIPTRLRTREVAHDSLTELFVVDSMHARKTMMATLADAFIALPGGWGTLEEVFEVTTWTQLGYHHKPVGILNIDHYYDSLLEFLDRGLSLGFIRKPHRQILQSDDTLDGLLEKLATVELPEGIRWLDKP